MRCRLFFFVFILGLVLSVAPASGAPITFTMSITEGASTFFGEPDSVLSLSIGSDVSLAMLVDVLSPRLFQLTATGTIVDKIDLVEFDGAFSPERQIGVYEFTNVLFTSVTASSTVNGLPTETVDFRAASQTFTQVPEPSGISVLLSAGLLCVRRSLRPNRHRRLGL